MIFSVFFTLLDVLPYPISTVVLEKGDYDVELRVDEF